MIGLIVAAVAGMVGAYFLGRYQGENAAYSEIFGEDNFVPLVIEDVATETVPEVVDAVAVVEVAPVVAAPVAKVKKVSGKKTTKAKKTTKKSK